MNQYKSGVVELRAADNACIAIYMSLHVSQIQNVSQQVRDAWVIGQAIYFHRRDKSLSEIKCST